MIFDKKYEIMMYKDFGKEVKDRGYMSVDTIKSIENRFKKIFPSETEQESAMLHSLKETYMKKESLPLYVEGLSFDLIKKTFLAVIAEQKHFLNSLNQKDEFLSCFSGRFFRNIFDIDKDILNSETLISLAEQEGSSRIYDNIRSILSIANLSGHSESFINYKNMLCDLNAMPSSSLIKYQLKYSTEAMLNKESKDIYVNESGHFFMNEKDFYSVYLRAKHLCHKYDLKFISIENRYMKDKNKAISRIEEIESLLMHFCKLTHIENENFGLKRIGLIFREKNKLNLEQASPAEFMACSPLKDEILGSIVIYSENKSILSNDKSILMKIEHEYLHAMDYLVGSYMEFMRPLPFTHLSFDKKRMNPLFLEKVKELIYLISDEKNQMSDDKIKEKIKKYKDTLFNHLIENISENLISHIKDKVDSIDFVDKYLSCYLLQDKNGVKKAWELTLLHFEIPYEEGNFKKHINKILGNAILRMDIDLETYFEKPTPFIKKIMTFSTTDIRYFKKPTERLAWVSLFAKNERIREKLSELYNLVHSMERIYGK